MMQGWYYVESLTGQRHDRVQTESQITTVNNCFDLVGPLQHGVASCEVLSWSTDIHKTHYMQMMMTFRWNSNPNPCQLANVTCKTRDKGQKEKSRISCRCRDKETADRHKLPRRKIMAKAGKKWAAYRIWKELRPQKYWTVESNDAEDRKRKCCLPT